MNFRVFWSFLGFGFGFIKLYLTLKSGLLGVGFGLFSVEFCFIMSKKATKYFFKTSKKSEKCLQRTSKESKEMFVKDGEALSDDELQSLKKSAVIKVDEVRTVNEFLCKKSFDGKWRIVVIDSVDDMNTASANAILKILEEPPAKSLLILISHNPNRLLPTIRSRCAKIS